MKPKRLEESFFYKDALELAPALVGKLLVRKQEGQVRKLRITETEAYRGEEDSACHARAGKTGRTAVMYGPGGRAYIYMIYGLHFLLNVVSGKEGEPQAVLIRCAQGHPGPARLTKALEIGKELNGEELFKSNRLWLEDDGYIPRLKTAPRVGIDYAAEPFRSIPWRFINDL